MFFITDTPYYYYNKGVASWPMLLKFTGLDQQPILPNIQKFRLNIFNNRKVIDLRIWVGSNKKFPVYEYRHVTCSVHVTTVTCTYLTLRWDRMKFLFCCWLFQFQQFQLRGKPVWPSWFGCSLYAATPHADGLWLGLRVLGESTATVSGAVKNYILGDSLYAPHTLKVQ